MHHVQTNADCFYVLANLRQFIGAYDLWKLKYSQTFLGRPPEKNENDWHLWMGGCYIQVNTGQTGNIARVCEVVVNVPWPV